MLMLLKRPGSVKNYIERIGKLALEAEAAAVADVLLRREGDGDGKWIACLRGGTSSHIERLATVGA